MGRLRNLFTGFKDRILRRKVLDTEEASEKLFRQAVTLVKEETQKELLTSFKDYRQNLKFAYLFSFIKQYTQALVQVFRDFGDAAMVDIGHLQEVAKTRGSSQEDTTEDLAIVLHRLQYAAEHLRSLEGSLGVQS
jgi:hypothetical protein